MYVLIGGDKTAALSMMFFKQDSLQWVPGHSNSQARRRSNNLSIFFSSACTTFKYGEVKYGNIENL